MNYNDQFRSHQRLQVSVLNPTPVANYLPIQKMEARQLLQDLREHGGGSGSDVHLYFQRTIASMIHVLLYGFRVRDLHDPVLVKALHLNEEFSDFLKVGAHIVDTFPILNNLPEPLAPWKKKAEDHYQLKTSLRTGNFKRGLTSEAWTISKHLKRVVEKENMSMPPHELAFELGTMIDAALDGTTDTLIWFIVACVNEDRGFLDKARAELDSVIGRDRLPTFEDKLPYIGAITEELFRWRPVGPEGVPHLNNAEVTYEGYRIPKSSVIVPNVWSICREEAVFGPNPDSFEPDRWMENGELKELPVGLFGFGRRACPGRHFARNFIKMAIAQIIWSFEIGPGLDNAGQPIPVDAEACTDGLVMRAHPFKARFTSRGPWVDKIIGDEGDTWAMDHISMLNDIGSNMRVSSD
jgi:cytochrome P450